MLLPIIAYGHPILKQRAKPVRRNEAGLEELINNMFETMYAANGVGLAAPQIGQSLRLFIVDSSRMMMEGQSENDTPPLKKVFINATILQCKGAMTLYNEGCLSIPGIREDVARSSSIVLRYMDKHFVTYEEEFDGLNARIIQHEYDHIEGVLFIDHLPYLKKRLLQNQLLKISRGEVNVSYPMLFPTMKKVKK